MAEKAGITSKKIQQKGKESASKKPKANPPQPVSIFNQSPVEQILYLQRTFGNRAVTGLIQSRTLQAKLKIGKADDKYEKEADHMADRVMKKDEGSLVNGQKSLVKRQEDKKENIQAKSISPKSENKSQPSVSSQFESRLSATKGGGQPLPDDTRDFMETRFDADFSDVRVHTGSDAAQMNKNINAKAFTSGKDIYFGAGGYNTDTSAGKHLLAHELTHTIQQGASVKKKSAGLRTTAPLIQRSKWVPDWVKKTVKKGASLVKGAVKTLGNVRNWALNKLKGYLRKIPGYHLLTVIIGQDIVTGKRVPRTARNLIKGLLGSRKYNKLNKTGSIGRAFRWLKRQLKELNITYPMMVRLFKNTVSYFVKNPTEIASAFKILKKNFAPPISRILRFAKNVGWTILKFVLEGALKMAKAPVERIMKIINRGRTMFRKILSNPIGFARNLLNAVKKGFNLFAGNFFKHLKASMASWLFGTLSGAGIQLPKKFDVKGVFYLVAQILDFTYQSIKTRVIKKLGPRGPRIVAGLEKTVEFVKELVTKGPNALWERVKEKLGNLKEMVFNEIIVWVRNTIIVKAVLRIINMFHPAGILAQAAQAIFDVIMFFINRWEQIKALAQAVVNSITPIVYGRVTRAAKWVEKVMARGLTVIISFLARMAGLGGISNKIREIIQKIRKPIDKVVDKVIGWMVKKGKALFRKGKAGARAVKRKIIEWWKVKKKFKLGKKSHNLTFKGKGKHAQIVIRSDEKILTQHFAKLKSENFTDEQLDPARKKARNIDQLMKVKMTKKVGEQIASELGKLADLLATLGGKDVEVPASNVKLEPTAILSSVVGKNMKAEPLSIKHGNTTGSQPTQGTKLWDAVRQRNANSKQVYVKGHLLNHKLFGPGIKENLTPITRTFNLDLMEPKVERKAKEAVLSQNRVISYEVNVNYRRHGPRKFIPEESDLATSFTFKMNYMKKIKPDADGTNPLNWKVDESDKGKILYFSELHKLPEDLKPDEKGDNQKSNGHVYLSESSKEAIIKKLSEYISEEKLKKLNRKQWGVLRTVKKFKELAKILDDFEPFIGKIKEDNKIRITKRKKRTD